MLQIYKGKDAFETLVKLRDELDTLTYQWLPAFDNRSEASSTRNAVKCLRSISALVTSEYPAKKSTNRVYELDAVNLLDKVLLCGQFLKESNTSEVMLL